MKSKEKKNVRLVVGFLALVLALMVGCRRKEAAPETNDAGVYRLYSMVAGTDSYDHETILKYGLNAMCLILYDDGSASLAFGDETPSLMSWERGVILDGEDRISYKTEEKFLTLTHRDETLVFERVGDAPKKAEIQSP